MSVSSVLEFLQLHAAAALPAARCGELHELLSAASTRCAGVAAAAAPCGWDADEGFGAGEQLTPAGMLDLALLLRPLAAAETADAASAFVRPEQRQGSVERLGMSAAERKERLGMPFDAKLEQRRAVDVERQAYEAAAAAGGGDASFAAAAYELQVAAALQQVSGVGLGEEGAAAGGGGAAAAAAAMPPPSLGSAAAPAAYAAPGDFRSTSQQQVHGIVAAAGVRSAGHVREQRQHKEIQEYWQLLGQLREHYHDETGRYIPKLQQYIDHHKAVYDSYVEKCRRLEQEDPPRKPDTNDLEGEEKAMHVCYKLNIHFRLFLQLCDDSPSAVTAKPNIDQLRRMQSVLVKIFGKKNSQQDSLGPTPSSSASQWGAVAQSSSKAMAPKPARASVAPTSSLVSHLKLPYDSSALQWDDRHNCNEQNVYCYCGKEAHTAMVQCISCKQWYHWSCTKVAQIMFTLEADFFPYQLNYRLQCACCSPEEQFELTECKWKETIEGLTAYLMWKHKTRGIKVEAVKQICKDHWNSVCKGRNVNPQWENALNSYWSNRKEFYIRPYKKFWGIPKTVWRSPVPLFDACSPKCEANCDKCQALDRTDPNSESNRGDRKQPAPRKRHSVAKSQGGSGAASSSTSRTRPVSGRKKNTPNYAEIQNGQDSDDGPPLPYTPSPDESGPPVSSLIDYSASINDNNIDSGCCAVCDLSARKLGNKQRNKKTCHACGSTIPKHDKYWQGVITDFFVAICQRCVERAAVEAQEAQDGRKVVVRAERGEWAAQPQQVPTQDLVAALNEDDAEEWVQCPYCEDWYHYRCIRPPFHPTVYGDDIPPHCPKDECDRQRSERIGAQTLEGLRYDSTLLGRPGCRVSVTIQTEVESTMRQWAASHGLARYISRDTRNPASAFGAGSAERFAADAKARWCPDEAAPPAARVGEVTVRMVSNVQRQLDPGEALRERYGYPEDVNYMSKNLFAFYKTPEGDEICFFALMVQEFDRDCPMEQNRLSSYIAYLDANQLYHVPGCYAHKPEDDKDHVEGNECKNPLCRQERRALYDGILHGYIKYLMLRGFEKAYIWVLPPESRNNDYVFHYPDRFVPTRADLEKWYLRLLTAAQKKGFIREISHNAQKTKRSLPPELLSLNPSGIAAGAAAGAAAAVADVAPTASSSKRPRHGQSRADSGAAPAATGGLGRSGRRESRSSAAAKPSVTPGKPSAKPNAKRRKTASGEPDAAPAAAGASEQTVRAMPVFAGDILTQEAKHILGGDGSDSQLPRMASAQFASELQSRMKRREMGSHIVCHLATLNSAPLPDEKQLSVGGQEDGGSRNLNDRDKVMQHCIDSHFQFNDLRHGRFSTMMLLNSFLHPSSTAARPLSSLPLARSVSVRQQDEGAFVRQVTLETSGGAAQPVAGPPPPLAVGKTIPASGMSWDEPDGKLLRALEGPLSKQNKFGDMSNLVKMKQKGSADCGKRLQQLIGFMVDWSSMDDVAAAVGRLVQAAQPAATLEALLVSHLTLSAKQAGELQRQLLGKQIADASESLGVACGYLKGRSADPAWPNERALRAALVKMLLAAE